MRRQEFQGQVIEFKKWPFGHLCCLCLTFQKVIVREPRSRFRRIYLKNDTPISTLLELSGSLGAAVPALEM